MYPRFVQLLLNKQLPNLPADNSVIVSSTLSLKTIRAMHKYQNTFSKKETTLFNTMLVAPSATGGVLPTPPGPNDDRTTTQVAPEHTSGGGIKRKQGTKKPTQRKSKKIKQAVEIPVSTQSQPTVSTQQVNISDENVHSGRAATTATSPLAEQDSGNINQTQPEATSFDEPMGNESNEGPSTNTKGASQDVVNDSTRRSHSNVDETRNETPELTIDDLVHDVSLIWTKFEKERGLRREQQVRLAAQDEVIKKQQDEINDLKARVAVLEDAVLQILKPAADIQKSSGKGEKDDTDHMNVPEDVVDENDEGDEDTLNVSDYGFGNDADVHVEGENNDADVNVSVAGDVQSGPGINAFPLNKGLPFEAVANLYLWDVMGEHLDAGRRVSFDKSVETEEMEGGSVKVEERVLTYNRKKSIPRRKSKSTISTPIIVTTPTTVTTPTPVIINPTPVNTIPTPVNTIPTPVNTISTTVTTTPATRIILPPVTIQEPSSSPKPKSDLPKIDAKDKGKGKLKEQQKVKKIVEPVIDIDEARRAQEEHDERMIRMAAEAKRHEGPDVDVILEDMSVVTLSQKAAKMLNDMALKGQGLSAPQIHRMINRKDGHDDLDGGFAKLKLANEEKARKKRQAELEKKRNKPPTAIQRKKELVKVLGGRYAPRGVLEGWSLERLEKAYARHQDEGKMDFENKIMQDKFIKKKLAEDRKKIEEQVRREEQERIELKEQEEVEAKEKELKNLSDQNLKIRWNGVLASDNLIPDLDRDVEEMRKYIKEVKDVKENVQINHPRSSKIVEWEGKSSKVAGLIKEQIKIVREDGNEQFLTSVADVLKNVNRLDILDLYELISHRNRQASEVIMERDLERCLMMLFEPEPFTNLFLNCIESVNTWRHFLRSGVHMILFRSGDTIYMLDDRRYVLGTQILRNVLASQLRTTVISEGAFNALYMVLNQFHKRIELERLREEDKKRKQEQSDIDKDKD